ncbi:hypothetical protein ACOIDL_28425, partial [Klebsiella pneumoniae]
NIAVLSHLDIEVSSAFFPFSSVEAGETVWSHLSHFRCILRLDGDFPSLDTLRGYSVSLFIVLVFASGLWHPLCRNL